MGVRMRHPDLDAEIVVPASAVPIHAGSGWQAVEGQEDMGETLPPEAQPFEGQPPVRMRHPDLDTEITVAESAVPQHRSNGWLIVEDDTEAEAVVEAGADVDRLTVEQLRDLARARGAQVSGTKAELQERLRSEPAQVQDQQDEPGEAAEQNPKEGE
jgi:hypothetical protein